MVVILRLFQRSIFKRDFDSKFIYECECEISINFKHVSKRISRLIKRFAHSSTVLKFCHPIIMGVVITFHKNDDEQRARIVVYAKL